MASQFFKSFLECFSFVNKEIADEVVSKLKNDCEFKEDIVDEISRSSTFKSAIKDELKLYVNKLI